MQNKFQMQHLRWCGDRRTISLYNTE